MAKVICSLPTLGISAFCKVDKAGVVTTVAGTGRRGYSGDEGKAVEASLSNPRSLTFDAAGNLYISDQYNHCLRMVNKSGVITRIAGNRQNGCSGDGGHAAKARLSMPLQIAFAGADNLYICDSLNSRVRKVDRFGIIATVVAGKGRFAN